MSTAALQLCGNLRGGRLSTTERAQRAWSAGYWARFTLAGRVSKPRPTTPIDVANTTYVVLRAEGITSPVCVEKASDYRALLRDFEGPSISHGFASKAEARVYCLGAAVPYPENLYNGVERFGIFGSGQCGAFSNLLAPRSFASGGGFLVAMPAAPCLPGSLPVIQNEAGVIGPHKRMEVPGVRMVEDGLESLGIDLDVQLVDLSVGALGAILPLSQVAESEDQGLIGFGQDLDVIPDPTILVAMASEWLSVRLCFG